MPRCYDPAMRRSLMLLAIFCAPAGATDEARPPLRIASDAAFAPFHFIDEAGRPDGFELRLARAVAARAGFRPEMLVLPYDELFRGLAAGTHDLVAATTGITPARERRYLFSRPYFATCQVAVVRAAAGEPQSLAELAGRRVGAAGEGTSRRAMLSIDAEHVRIGDGAGIAMLESGGIDAWIVDEFDGVAAVRDTGGRLRVLDEGVAPEHYAFVLAKGSAELVSRLDGTLVELEQSGELNSLRRKFGLDRAGDWPIACTSSVSPPN